MGSRHNQGIDFTDQSLAQPEIQWILLVLFLSPEQIFLLDLLPVLLGAQRGTLRVLPLLHLPPAVPKIQSLLSTRAEEAVLRAGLRQDLCWKPRESFRL